MSCEQVDEQLAEIVDGDREHADHIASCDRCRDARHEATLLAARVAGAGSDHVPRKDLVERLLARLDVVAPSIVVAPPPVPAAIVAPAARRTRIWMPLGAAAAAIAAIATAYVAKSSHSSAPTTVASSDIGKLEMVTRAAADQLGGVEIADRNSWRPLRIGDSIPSGAELRTDERTRASIDLTDGTHLVLDHQTTISFDDSRHLRVTAGRLLADVAHVADRPAQVATPAGVIDVVGTRFVVTATATTTSVLVTRGAVVMRSASGAHDDVRAGEEGTIDRERVTVDPAPSLAHDVEWAELAPAQQKSDEAIAGLGALRAYKPGEKRDRDWNLALANHTVKVRIVGPIARTEITETFRNDSTTELEGVYQFPLPPDAQIDGLALDSKDAPGGFIDGAFVDKQRGAKIWQGVIDKATPKPQQIATNEIIWVDGSWRDPALLDWQRGGRFELRVFPIPAKGQRTIKLAYTQVVAPHGAWRDYIYPLPHSSDGSTVADQMNVDVEVRGAASGQVHASGYALTADPARRDVDGMTLSQSGFVPRGDLVVTYQPVDASAELRAWTFQGGAAVAPDDKLAQKQHVGLDPAVLAAQRAEAADTRPTAVLALRPKLPRWQDTKPRDYMIVLDSSQSMVGERFTRATELATTLVDQMDRRDRFSVMTCDSECRSFGDVRVPSTGATAELRTWLAAQPPAGATDVVASIRAARDAVHGNDDRERWVLYVGDGFASTGFRRVADIERALASASGSADSRIHISTIGIGGDADAAVLAAAARGGGGSYLAWVPGQRITTAAVAALESTYGTALRDATVELPEGLADVAAGGALTADADTAQRRPREQALPTLRAGEEVLIAARVASTVGGDVIVRGTVAGQPFEQHYPLHLDVSTAAGNGFVPRLWASLAIDQRERAGTGEDRAKIVALSQAYGVMSRETSLLVLESQAMFDAFGVDRHVPAATWTGEDELDEVASAGTIPVAPPAKPEGHASTTPAVASASPPPPADKAKDNAREDDERPRAEQKAPMHMAVARGGGFGGGDGRGMFAMRRTWVRVASIATYDAASPALVKEIGDAERALQANPDSREKHRSLVQALSYAGELDRARDVAAKWLDRDRLDPQALGYEADLLGRAGQRELALRTLAGLVDLDADRVALHERMVQAYEQVGRMQQACSHRIALAALAPKDAKVAAAAMRCLRTVGRDGDAELVARALPDDATRAAAEKAAMVDAIAPRLAGDLVAAAHWTGGADLDLSLVTPDGTRVSWMGGRTDSIVTDATSTEREQLAIRSLRRGNYLLEITRGTPSTGTLRGAVDVTVLGAKRTLPFELVGDHVVVGRVGVTLQEQLEAVDDNVGAHMVMGAIADAELRRVMMARSPDLRACYANANPGIDGRVVLTITVRGDYGGVAIQTSASPGLEQVASCAKQALATMHTGSGMGRTFRVPLVFSN